MSARGDLDPVGDVAVAARRHSPPTPRAAAPLVAFGLVSATLLAITLRLERPVLLLAERYWPGWGGPLEALAVGAYAGLLTRALLASPRPGRLRLLLWLGFALVFFAQLGLGLAGLERLLMSGALHVPVPAVILGGPLFRGGGYFMLALFAVALLLLGPAWCSYLCYFGAFDGLAAAVRPRPRALPRWTWTVRIALLALLVATALGLRWGGAPLPVAAGAALVFGALGLAVMALASRATGTMTHCTVWCPLGLVATLAGRLNPWRVRIAASCTDCGACARACRYDALGPEQIAARRPGLRCTLCGDCLPACPHGSLQYHFPGLAPAASRVAFLTLAVSLHAITLACARV